MSGDLLRSVFLLSSVPLFSFLVCFLAALILLGHPAIALLIHF